jgi:peptide/nickel transport system ATP-binding protein
MEEAELRPAEAFFNRHPHELSGGQRQRAAIARAIVLHPRVLVADEPVSMLDVSVRAGILNLFKRFAREHGMAIVFITHDLSLIAHLCDEVAVMHRGLVLEQGSTRKVLSDPEHAYTRRLIDAVPRIRSCTAVSHSGSERTDGSPNRF